MSDRKAFISAGGMARKAVAAAALLLVCSTSPADTLVQEDFTGANTSTSWYFMNGACLTAGTGTSTSSPGLIPGCTHISYWGSENLVGGYNGVAGNSQTLPDPIGQGALRFTNGCTYTSTYGCSDTTHGGGHSQHGAIISNYTFGTSAGVNITFKTITYRGDSRGTAATGADGMSFFLMDGSVSPNTGPAGGTLGVTCSNTSGLGMIGAYLSVGIDEYGNFLNGKNFMPGYTGPNTINTSGTTTAYGYGFHANRIGLRGAGSIAWTWLHSNYPSYYPSSLNSSTQTQAVANTCKTGYLWDYSTSSPTQTSTAVMDYSPIPNAYKELSGVSIPTEYANGGYARTNAYPILYQLKVTQDGLLTMRISYNGGSWQSLISNLAISASNGSLPGSFRFGFAGSTGAGSNIHEVMCFKATPSAGASSSTALNQKETSKVQTGSQAYFAFYDPNTYSGRLTANALSTDSSGNLVIASTATWDASCVLTGLNGGATCPTTGATSAAAEAPSSRVILTWNGTTGIAFEWSSLTNNQQTTLDAGDSSATNQRLLYLRGDRTNEIDSSGNGLYRARDSVLADIADSSPAWVGPPTSPYAITWMDRLHASSAMPENSATTNYSAYVTNNKTRTNVVYVGANDGLLHGFRAGSYSSSGTYVSTSNDGYEVLAYMPGAILNTIHNASDTSLDYSNTQYGHNFYVDATPATGDLYYSGTWHTWLVGGLGAGGAAIYALDVSNPTNFSETNAASVVIGEWSASNITCANSTTCANNLGNTYGTPLIRRLHNGTWAILFGNGIGSSTGDAGLFIMTIDPQTTAKTFYYLSTGVTGSNGIVQVSAADFDGDHITDYVYAGDLLGNVWRFDLTSLDPTNWAASSAPLFSAGSGNPITTAVAVDLVTGPISYTQTQVMIAFGTGRKTPWTNTAPTSYQSGTQYLYAFWDWNMTSWNSISLAQFLTLSPTATGLAAPYTLGQSNLQQQTVTVASSGNRDITASNICWAGTITCTAGAQFGWYIALPGTSEQIIYGPSIVSTAFVINSIVPADSSLLSCTTNADTGYTYAISMLTGGSVPNFFPRNSDTGAAGIETDATGTPSVVTTANGSTTNSWLVYQTISGAARDTQITPANNVSGSRRTWIQLR